MTRKRKAVPRTLVAGWFSFEKAKATAGDLRACEVACRWLRAAGHKVDVAFAPPFLGGVDWQTANPSSYTHLIFVCGPMAPWPAIRGLFERFANSKRMALDVSLLLDPRKWDPFELLLERDSVRAGRPDLSLLSPREPAPVAGMLLVHAQPEYGAKGRHNRVNEALRRLAQRHGLAVVPIDTRLDENANGYRDSRQVEGVISRMDVILTTRLHGLVLALKYGVPAISIDPISGGEKVFRQAKTLGWPARFLPETVSDRELDRALRFCLGSRGRRRARVCAAQGRRTLQSVRTEFLRQLRAIV